MRHRRNQGSSILLDPFVDFFFFLTLLDFSVYLELNAHKKMFDLAQATKQKMRKPSYTTALHLLKKKCPWIKTKNRTEYFGEESEVLVVGMITQAVRPEVSD